MSDLSFDRDRLEELLLASANEAFSVEERNDLNALLLGNAAARSFAVQFLSLDSALAESLGASEAARHYATNNEQARSLSPACEPDALEALPAATTSIERRDGKQSLQFLGFPGRSPQNYPHLMHVFRARAQ